ncbi:whole genome shotgun sequence [Seminavis robusta]|uniref:Whole genome shotgun sequence n=1 Tax=Seminavis robusta TaxID=568900 RepID=A0A9N8EJG4_9STRA|nr:whole genome shotgun sequence [Seminavis robusta]|eukprot:Sro1278_g258780.1 whole genome shotgun sequence (767) ;mRNA; f:13975-16275
MMSELFHRSLGIRQDGRCHRHPDVCIMEPGASSLGSCHLCAMEAHKELLRDDTATTMSNSFFWSSAASLSLTSSFRTPQISNGSKHYNATTSGNSAAGGSGRQPYHPPHQQQQHQQQPSSEEMAEKQQQQQFFESIITRWVQVQDGSLQQSIALSTPLILHELRKLEAKVHQQEATIQSQQKTIQELRQSIDQKHTATQELLQTILQTVVSSSSNNNNNNNSSNKVEEEEEEEKQENIPFVIPTTRKARNNTTNNGKSNNTPQQQRTTLKRRPSMNSMKSAQRSIDSGVKQPLTRHDSNASFTINDLQPHPLTPTRGRGGAMSASQPIQFTSPLPAHEIQIMSLSHTQLSPKTEIALDGSHHSLERSDLPDMEAIFEEGFGKEMLQEKKKKFQIPPNYSRRQSAAAQQGSSRPMEIILETNEKSNRKLMIDHSSPEEILGFKDMDMVALQNVLTPLKNKKQQQNKNSNNMGVEGHVSLVTLDAGSDHASDLSESDHHAPSQVTSVGDDDDEDDETHDDTAPAEPPQVFLMDQEPNDYSFENLQHVSRYKMIDMYGDRGTYTGTLGDDKEPSGFGTMKYDSGRFYKGEWKKGRWNGKGTLLNANGDSYQGDFVSDARHGRGVYRFTSGDVYEGDFFEDNRHGTGKFKFHNGSVYNGEFCMGSFEGYGRYDFDGGYYEGEWKRDEYYGKGKLQYKDGSNYQGRFKRGSAHGFGEERLADGTVRCGSWKRGEFLQECTEEECKRMEAGGATSRNRNKLKAGDEPPPLAS